MSKVKQKILVFDIETSLMEIYSHCIGYKLNIGYHQIKKHRAIICIAYKWLGEKTTQVLHWDVSTQDDSEMLKEFNKIAGSADLLIAHNGLGFDIKEIRGYIALRKLDKAWCETPCIDTLKKVRAAFRFPSNKLDDLAKMLGIGQKNKMCFQDWIDVTNGDETKLRKMTKYCIKDVIVLEKMYKALEKYLPSQPKDRIVSSQINLTSCSECGSTNVIKNGTYRHRDNSFQRYLCRDCFSTLKLAR